MPLSLAERRYIFGNCSEDNILSIFSTNNNIISVIQGERYDIYDFLVITKNSILLLELKTRIFNFDKYNKTYFQADKLDNIKNIRNELKVKYDNKKFFFICLIGFTKGDYNNIEDIDFNENNEIVNMPDIEYHYIVYNKQKFAPYEKILSTWRDKPQLTINIPIADIKPFDNLISMIDNNII